MLLTAELQPRWPRCSRGAATRSCRRGVAQLPAALQGSQHEREHREESEGVAVRRRVARADGEAALEGAPRKRNIRVGFFFTGPAQSREALLEGAPVASHFESIAV